jgi:ABC-type nitrate/sulfonate/bicarbonate transport system substrate-binding protein
MNRIISREEFRSRMGVVGRALIGYAVALMVAASTMMTPVSAKANPYLARPGEAPVTVHVATCATSGGFVHLYTALDHRLFEKYGIKVEYREIRGSGISLAALATDEIQFLYCAADATIPGLATGSDAKLVAAVLVGQPWVLLARKDVKNPTDLKGKIIGVVRPGDVTYRLAKAFVTKLNLTDEVKILPVGGTGQVETFNALAGNIVQACLVTPPLDVRGKKEGFNVIYNLNDLGLPSIYSSLHTNSKTLKERPGLVQRFVAAMAEAIHFVETNPDKANASVGKALKLRDEESLHSAYNAYAKSLINRRMIVSANAVVEAVEVAREAGTNVKRKPADLFDNTFVENLEKSGFLKEIWGGEVPGK